MNRDLDVFAKIVPARTDIDQIDADLRNLANEHVHLLFAPLPPHPIVAFLRALKPVWRTEAREERLVFPCCPHGAEDAQREPDTVFEGLTSPLICARIAERRQEWGYQEAMGRVNFDEVNWVDLD